MAVMVSNRFVGNSHSQVGVGSCLQKLSRLVDVVQARGAMELGPVEFAVFDHSIDTHKMRVLETGALDREIFPNLGIRSDEICEDS